MGIVDRAIWFIEGQFNRSPSLEDVARAVGVSRYGLSRTFTWTTGISVMAYVRARKLTEAYKALRNGAPGILGVALDAGYNSHEGFTRAFRDQFGITPEEARNKREIDERLLMEPIKMEDRTASELKDPRREERVAFTVVGLGARFRMDATEGIPSLWQKFQQYEGSLDEVPGYWYGVCGDWRDTREDFFYMAGVEVTREPTDLPAELTTYKFPARSYLVFRHETHISELRRTIAAIFERYLPQNGFELWSMKAYFEFYDEAFDPRTGLGGIEMWMPVTKESEEWK
jgi:AraC family transcriptional regulator